MLLILSIGQIIMYIKNGQNHIRVMVEKCIIIYDE